jgi:adenine-specific DNA-methyltransferase
LGNYLETDEERYNFTWHGKSKARRIAQTVSTGTLRPCKAESKHWDTTQNLFIEGDNLEVLKLLQKSYHKQVKMIYIDPPYNTGKEFIYPDNYQDNLDTYLEYTGQQDGEGRKFGTNAETSGRYHTNWLNMMYPRLKLARNLLRDDGVIFISIDDNEQVNLKKLCDEIFGEENFISCFCWQKFHSVKSNAEHSVSTSHDYILLYAKNKEYVNLNKLPMSEEALSVYKNPDNDPRGEWRTAPLTVSLLTGSRGESFKRTGKSTGLYDLVAHNGKIHKPTAGRCWIAKETIKKLDEDNRIWWGKDGNAVPMQKIFLAEKGGTKTITTFWNHTEFGSNKKANEELKDLFPENTGETSNFPTPKPTKLLETIIDISCDSDNDIIFDFFSGSSSTADAVMKSNVRNNTSRSFVLIQLPEIVDLDKYKTIADIGKERIRRAGDKIKFDNVDKEDIDTLDIGFKVFKLSSSNIKPWDADFDTLESALFSSVDNIKDDRSAEDVLYEILLKYGLDLTVPIEERQLGGKTLYSIGFGALVICLDDAITLDVVEAIGGLKAELEPEVMRVVFKDSGFEDVVKTNAIQILKKHGIDDVKSL